MLETTKVEKRIIQLELSLEELQKAWPSEIPPTKSVIPLTRMLALVTDAFGGYGGIAQYNRDFITALSKASGVGRIVVLPRLGSDDSGESPASVHQLAPIFSRVKYTIYSVILALRLRPAIIFSGHLHHGPLAATVAKLAGAQLCAHRDAGSAYLPCAQA